MRTKVFRNLRSRKIGDGLRRGDSYVLNLKSLRESFKTRFLSSPTPHTGNRTICCSASRHFALFVPTAPVIPVNRFLRLNTKMHGRDSLPRIANTEQRATELLVQSRLIPHLISLSVRRDCNPKRQMSRGRAPATADLCRGAILACNSFNLPARSSHSKPHSPSGQHRCHHTATTVGVTSR